jgi:hypothetical protein
MRAFFLALVFLSTQLCAYDLTYNCDYPTERENGSALNESEIAGVMVRYSVGGSVGFVDDTDGNCGGQLVGVPGGEVTIDVAAYDTNDVYSKWSTPITVQVGPDEVRILGPPLLTISVTANQGGGSVVAEARINFGPTAAASTNVTWNDINATDQAPSALNDITGAGLGWTLTIDAAANAQGSLGIESVGSGDAAWIDESVITDTYQYVNDSTVATYTVSGLDNSKTYDLEFLPSRTSGSSRVSEYSADGFVTSVTVDAYDNSTLTGIISAVSPVGGAITFEVRAESGSSYGYINAARVVENVSEDTLNGSLNGGSTSSGDVTTAINLLSTVTGNTVTAGALSASIDLASGITGNSTLTASLLSEINFGGTITAGSSASTALSTTIQLDGTLFSTSTTSGNLFSPIELDGLVSAGSSSAAALSSSILLNGGLFSSASTSASLLSDTALNGDITASATLTAQLLTQINASGNSSGASFTSSDLVALIQLAADSVSGSASTAALLTGDGLDGSLSGNATTAGNLNAFIQLLATTSASSTTNAALDVNAQLSGTLFGNAFVNGGLENNTAILNGASIADATTQADLSSQIILNGLLAANSSQISNLSTQINFGGLVAGDSDLSGTFAIENIFQDLDGVITLQSNTPIYTIQ